MSVRTIGGNLLFWKITAVFSALLIVLGIAFTLIASASSASYYNDAHQQLYGNLAQHLATVTRPFKNGKPDTAVTHDIIHATMVANPSVEVYLIDTTGRIVDYVVPDTTVKITRVNMAPIHEWLSTVDQHYPTGDNPKQPDTPSIFSVAPVYENQVLVGYVYVVLGSQRQTEILSSVNNNWQLRLGFYIFFAAMVAAFIVGVVTFFLITDSICSIAATVQRFKEGDYSARISGQAGGNIGVLTSTFNEMADVIVANFEKITATDKFRQELIANVSHDLRTPLSIMQGYVETMIMKKETLSTADRDKYLTIVHEGTKKLSALVEQLFQYAKLEANVIVPHKESFLLNELVSDILMTYQLQAHQHQVTLELQSPERLPAVFADIALTERVFQNLLDNAFRFTPAGGQITITLSPFAETVVARVTDTGTGIALEEQVNIFDRHIRFGESTSKGMGIGLAIVKKILELHESVIKVSSEKGKGASFEFALPCMRKNLSGSVSQ